MRGENELLPELAIAYRDKVFKDSKELLDKICEQ